MGGLPPPAPHRPYRSVALPLSQVVQRGRRRRPPLGVARRLPRCSWSKLVPDRSEGRQRSRSGGFFAWEIGAARGGFFAVMAGAVSGGFFAETITFSTQPLDTPYRAANRRCDKPAARDALTGRIPRRIGRGFPFRRYAPAASLPGRGAFQGRSERAARFASRQEHPPERMAPPAFRAPSNSTSAARPAGRARTPRTALPPAAAAAAPVGSTTARPP